MLTQWIDAFLDALHGGLRGTARERRGAPEAPAAIAAFALAIVAFGFELANATLGVDDFAHLAMPFDWNSFWIGRGSWGTLLVQFLTPEGWITPFVSLLVGLLLQLLTAVLLGWGLGASGLAPAPLALLYTLFVTFPYFACQTAFSYVQIAYPLASLAMVSAVLLALAGDRRRVVGAVLAVAFAMSLYQGSLSVLVPAALLIPAAGMAASHRDRLGRYVRVALVVLAGGALYLALHKAILGLTGIAAPPGRYSVSFDLRFWERLGLIQSEIRFLFLGAGDVIPPKAVVIFLAAAAVALGQAVRQQHAARPRALALVQGIALGALLVVAPFAVLFLHEGELAPRSSVGVAVVWFVVYMWLLAARSTWVRRAGMAGLAVSVVMFSFHVNRMFYSQHLVTQADGIMIARIAERIDQLATPDDAGAADVVLIGQYSHPGHEGMPRFVGSVLGYSQFEWGHGETRMYVRALALTYGVSHYRWHEAAELRGAFQDSALLRGRQPWPHRSSVFWHDGHAVVWLGERRPAPRIATLERWLRDLAERVSGR